LHLMKLGRIDAAGRRQLLARKETDIASELLSKRSDAFPEEYVLLALRAYRRSKIGFDRLTGLLRLTSSDEVNQLRQTLELRKLLHDDDRAPDPSLRTVGAVAPLPTDQRGASHGTAPGTPPDHPGPRAAGLA